MVDGPAESIGDTVPESQPEASPPAAPAPVTDAGGRLDRRTLLKGLGAGLMGVSLAPLLAACGSNSGGKKVNAPVGNVPAGGTPAIQISPGTSLNILMWNHFVPAFDTFFNKFAQDWGTANNVKVRTDHVDIAQLPGRLAAEVAAKKGHDLFAFEAQVQTRRYEKYLVNVDGLMKPLIAQFGDVNAIAKSVAQVNGAWLGIPSFNVLIAPLIRTDLLKEKGLNKPATLDDLMSIGKVMRQAQHPAGLAISHCNDANHNWRAIMWDFGASEVHADGKTLALDTKEMRDFLSWAKEFQASVNSDEVYAWQDVSDNQYLGSGTGFYIHDAISSLRSLQGQNDTLYNNIDILADLRGPKGQFSMADPQVWAMWNFTSKANLEAATAFLYYYMTHFKETFTASQGYNMPVFANLLKKPMPILGEDPKYNVLQDYQGDLLQTFGYPGPPTPAAEEVLAQYIIPDMVAKVRNGSVDDAIKWATDQIKPIYAKQKGSVVTPSPGTPVP